MTVLSSNIYIDVFRCWARVSKRDVKTHRDHVIVYYSPTSLGRKTREITPGKEKISMYIFLTTLIDFWFHFFRFYNNFINKLQGEKFLRDLKNSPIFLRTSRLRSRWKSLFSTVLNIPDVEEPFLFCKWSFYSLLLFMPSSMLVRRAYEMCILVKTLVVLKRTKG